MRLCPTFIITAIAFFELCAHDMDAIFTGEYPMLKDKNLWDPPNECISLLVC